MADQEEYPPLGWLLECLQQGIGGIWIHVVDRIHDGNAETAHGRRLGEELRQFARIIDGDDLSGLAVVAEPLQHHQVGVGARRRPVRLTGSSGKNAPSWPNVPGRRTAPSSRRAAR